MEQQVVQLKRALPQPSQSEHKGHLLHAWAGLGLFLLQHLPWLAPARL